MAYNQYGAPAKSSCITMMKSQDFKSIAKVLRMQANDMLCLQAKAREEKAWMNKHFINT